MGVQLELDGTKLVVDTASRSVGSGCLSARRWSFSSSFWTGFPERAKKRFRAEVYSARVDGSTVKQKLFLVALLVLAVRGHLWCRVGRWISPL